MPLIASNIGSTFRDRCGVKQRLRADCMELSDFVALGDQQPPLRLLVIGGYAVGAHGHTRSTFDVDFLVQRTDRSSWVSRLTGAGLALFAETNAFAQFMQPQGGD